MNRIYWGTNHTPSRSFFTVLRRRAGGFSVATDQENPLPESSKTFGGAPNVIHISVYLHTHKSAAELSRRTSRTAWRRFYFQSSNDGSCQVISLTDRGKTAM